jgi:hypothetical protein
VVRAAGDDLAGRGLRPTLATDLAESDRDGRFELRLPPGKFILDAHHPRFAGVAHPTDGYLAVEPGDHVVARLVLTAGCVISGRVIGRDGRPVADGAIEQQGSLQYVPAGRVEADGTFRWATTSTAEVTLRAWPWKSPPSDEQRFACHDGARFSGVAFQIPDRSPDLEGVLVDAAGKRVGFAHVDLEPLTPGGIAQQERTDASGQWQIYDLAPGRYRVVAQAEGRGVTGITVSAPRAGLRLVLGGTGRLEGTTTRLASGSFELVLGACLDGTDDTRKIAVPQSRRLVTVTGGRFAVDDVPACELDFHAIWRGRVLPQHTVIPSGGVGRVELDLGPLGTKLVHGVVRDRSGEPVPGALVTATHHGSADAIVKADAAGAFAITTSSGASLRASLRGRIGFAQVGGASIERERVDLIVDEAEAAERP